MINPPRLPVMRSSTLEICLIRVGHLKGEVVVAALVVRQEISALGGPGISFALLLPNGV